MELGGKPTIGVCLSDVIDDVERGMMASELNALDEPEVEMLSLPKFGTWDAQDGAEDSRFGYWHIGLLCVEKGP